MQTQITTAQPMREDPPLTRQSIDDAIAAQLAERARATAETGIQFDGDRPYLPGRVLTVQQFEDEARRLEALETLTLIVNEYGPERVGLWVQNIGKLKAGQ